MNSDSGIMIIDSMVKENIKFLDLSENPGMGRKFYNKLAKYFDMKDFKIEKLFLENNKIQDD